MFRRRAKDRGTAALSPGSPAPAIDYLNLGCGRRFHPDWWNVDMAPADARVLRHDLTKPLPFPDRQFRVVYHSHVLEHLPRRQAPAFLKECYRVLKPGGCLRVVVPDLEVIARLYLENLKGALEGDNEAAKRHEWMTLELLDQMVRDVSGGEMQRYWRQNPMPAEAFVVARMGSEVVETLDRLRRREGPPPMPAPPRNPEEAGRFRAKGEIHQWMYDRLSLRRLLEGAGLEKVSVCAADQSRISDFRDYGLDENEDGSVRKPDSLFMEAGRPG